MLKKITYNITGYFVMGFLGDHPLKHKEINAWQLNEGSLRFTLNHKNTNDYIFILIHHKKRDFKTEMRF